MAYLRRPDYYKDFRCISSACTDSCCTDWEIDIDDENCSYYMQVEGEFGKRLKKEIAAADPESGEPAHFIQTKEERCPFLNADGLCDIFIHLGEEHLSYICTHHPRFYEWFCEGKEAGLGLCCEEAARLLLKRTGRMAFEILDEEDEEEAGAIEEEELALEEYLFGLREQIFDLIADPAMSYTGLLDHLAEAAKSMQADFDDKLYPFAEDYEDSETTWTEGYENSENALSEGMEGTTFADRFFLPEQLRKLCSFLQSLEINDMSWWGILKKVSDHAEEILAKRAAFEEFYGEKMEEYRQLLNYFVYRHFMKSRDGDLEGRLGFAVISGAILECLAVYHWMEKGSLSAKEQIDICKLYSKEIEYDEENTEALADYYVLNM